MNKILVPKKRGRGVNFLARKIKQEKGNALFQKSIFHIPAILQTPKNKSVMKK